MFVEKWPAGQTVHALARKVGLNVPTVHSLHSALPVPLAYVPGLQRRGVADPAAHCKPARRTQICQ